MIEESNHRTSRGIGPVDSTNALGLKLRKYSLGVFMCIGTNYPFSVLFVIVSSNLVLKMKCYEKKKIVTSHSQIREPIRI